MRLLITTPGAVAADVSDVVAIEAEDGSGHFGVWPHHANLVTALEPSVVAWRHADGRHGYCAVRGGLLTVTGGSEVAVATGEAILGVSLAALETTVDRTLAAEAAEERRASTHAEQLRVQAIRQMIGYLRPDTASAWRARP